MAEEAQVSDRVIPLFPLNVVLFPGMVLPMRIFEPRYKLMLERLLAGDRTFGVALIAEGEEVGEAATPHEIGTMAEIGAYEQQEDGDYMISCVGLRRFKVDRVIEGEPYLQAEITLLDEGDPADPVNERLISQCTEVLEGYLELLAQITNITVELPDEPLSPIDLSYLMAATLQVDTAQKQLLLEVPDAETRLDRALMLFKRESEEIRTFLAKSKTRGDFFYRGRRLSSN